MDDRTREALLRAATAKRQAIIKPGDITPEAWAIACDHAKDNGLGDGDRVTGNPAYLRYVPKHVVPTLQEQLPFVEADIRAGPGTRKVIMFRCQTLVAVLNFLGIATDRYIRQVYHARGQWNPL